MTLKGLSVACSKPALLLMRKAALLLSKSLVWWLIEEWLRDGRDIIILSMVLVERFIRSFVDLAVLRVCRPSSIEHI
jgi:hypothetical protein